MKRGHRVPEIRAGIATTGPHDTDDASCGNESGILACANACTMSVMAGKKLFQLDHQAGSRQDVSCRRCRMGAVNAATRSSRPSSLQSIGTTDVRCRVTAGDEVDAFLSSLSPPEAEWNKQSAWQVKNV